MQSFEISAYASRATTPESQLRRVHSRADRRRQETPGSHRLSPLLASFASMQGRHSLLFCLGLLALFTGERVRCTHQSTVKHDIPDCVPF